MENKRHIHMFPCGLALYLELQPCLSQSKRQVHVCTPNEAEWAHEYENVRLENANFHPAPSPLAGDDTAAPGQAPGPRPQPGPRAGAPGPGPLGRRQVPGSRKKLLNNLPWACRLPGVALAARAARTLGNRSQRGDRVGGTSPCIPGRSRPRRRRRRWRQLLQARRAPVGRHPEQRARGPPLYGPFVLSPRFTRKMSTYVRDSLLAMQSVPLHVPDRPRRTCT